MTKPKDWKIYNGTRKPHDEVGRLPDPPSWRPKRSEVGEERIWPTTREDDEKLPKAVLERGRTFHATPHIIEIVNAAIYLRRPLLVTGKPGSGKSSLVDAIAYELRLGAPLRWSVTSRSNLRDALYQYDAIGRLQEERLLSGTGSKHKGAWKAPDIGEFITLGPLGTALLPSNRPRALLIDEIDKSDIDLPNDLLNVFEEGEFEIPELKRQGNEASHPVRTSDPNQPKITVKGGVVRCCQFPIMVLSSNGEREFPAAFLRRCLRLNMPNPTGDQPEDENPGGKRLREIVKLHFGEQDLADAEQVIQDFLDLALNKKKDIATDQLLNAIYFVMESHVKPGEERRRVLEELMHELTPYGA